MSVTTPEALCIGQPRLTAGLDRLRRIDLAAYDGVFGRLPRLTAQQLISINEQVDLRGRGGAAFPVARKLSAVLEAARARKRAPIVVVNGAEGEPGSAKDRMLLLRSPYLVLAGAMVAARALRARLTSWLASATPLAARSVREAAAAEPGLARQVRVMEVPDRFVSGESGALINAMNGRVPLPSRHRSHASYSGLGRRPTLLSNTETFAQLAMLALAGTRGLRLDRYPCRARDGAAERGRRGQLARRGGGAVGAAAGRGTRPVRRRASRGRARRRLSRQLAAGTRLPTAYRSAGPGWRRSEAPWARAWCWYSARTAARSAR